MKIAVLTPYHGGADVEHYGSIEKLPHYITRIRVNGVGMVDQARAALVSIAKNAFADIVVFIDSDIIFEPGTVEALVSRISDQAPIVSGSYLAKDDRNVVVGFLGQPDACQAPEGLTPASRLGFGFIALHMSVFDKIGERLSEVIMTSAQGIKAKPWFLPMIHHGECLGEDFSFCVRAEQSGIRMYIDQNIRVLHKGMKRYAVTASSDFRFIPRNT